MNDHVDGVVAKWADAHPECRGRFLNRWLQFGGRVRAAPYAE